MGVRMTVSGSVFYAKNGGGIPFALEWSVFEIMRKKVLKNWHLFIQGFLEHYLKHWSFQSKRSATTVRSVKNWTRNRHIECNCCRCPKPVQTGLTGKTVTVCFYFCLLLLRRRQSKGYQYKYQFLMGFQTASASCRSEIRAPKMSLVSHPYACLT